MSFPLGANLLVAGYSALSSSPESRKRLYIGTLGPSFWGQQLYDEAT